MDLLQSIQLLSAVNVELQWFCFTSPCDWSRKLVTPSQPIKCKTKNNHDLVTRVFPLWAVCLFSLWVLIGSLKHFPSLWLAVVITLVFDVQSRCVVNCDVPLYYLTWPTDRFVFCFQLLWPQFFFCILFGTVFCRLEGKDRTEAGRKRKSWGNSTLKPYFFGSIVFAFWLFNLPVGW